MTDVEANPLVSTHPDRVSHDLGERVKELSALHGTARLLQDDARPLAELLGAVVELLPPAWQFPDLAGARIVLGDAEHRSSDFAVGRWCQTAPFTTTGGTSGSVEVHYRREAPAAAEGPFLVEERHLIDSLSEMLRSCVERREAVEALRRAHDELERRVAERTAELVRVNRALAAEVAERSRSEERVRSLAAELSLAEEAERRAIASELHDRIGQALALLKLKLVGIQRSAAFSGYETTLATMRTVLDTAIKATRTLTVEISPPILYELGLLPALEWLGEQFQENHGLRVEFSARGDERPDEVVALTAFKATRELLVNTVKHANARQVTLEGRCAGGRVRVSYRDDGVGFDVAAVDESGRQPTFGLFSVRERCDYLGGSLEITSAPGRGVHLVLDLPAHVEKSRRS